MAVRNDESGQAVTEYLLLLFTVVAAYLIVATGLAESGFLQKLVSPISDSFARAYQYGHPKAKGYEDGAPENHPRVTSGGNGNFRIFMSPRR